MVKWLHSKERKITWRTIWLRFMKDLGAYGSWMTQSRNRLGKTQRRLNEFWLGCNQNFSRARNIVNYSLFWCDTKEGQTFWGTLDEAWIATIGIDDFVKEFDEKEFLLKLNAMSQRFKMEWRKHGMAKIPDNYDESQFK